MANSKGYCRPIDDHHGKSLNVFERLSKVEARKRLNQLEDDANSHPDLMDDEPDHEFDFTLAMKDQVGGPKAFAISSLSKQTGFARPDPHDG